MKTIWTVLITLLVLLVLGVAVVYSGSFNIAADDPHWGVTTQVVETMRERSISRQAKAVPTSIRLDDSKLIANGASEYAEMCTACHLAPGMKDTELRKGLYPMPPLLTKHGAHRLAAEQFWIIKHGLKMSGMPAWGLTHDDERIWSMVAFLQKLPGMTSAQYQELVESGAGGHSHDHSDEGDVEEESDGHEHAEEAPMQKETTKGSQSDGHAHDHGAHDHGTSTSSLSLPPEVKDAAAVVDRFQKLLAHGKTREAAALLDPKVLIFEGGGAERSREEYASHHLNSDAEFLKTANVVVGKRSGAVVGDLAWIATESELKTQGTKPLNLLSTETMALRKTAQGWRITHIHWSSKSKK
jgi:mono/diheme cytochrome c family protein